MRHGRLAVRWVILLMGGTAACRLASPTPVVPARPAPLVRPGLEVLLSDSIHLVRGRRVGLVSNQAGVDRQGRGAVEVLLDAGVRLTALFSPEHGFRGHAAPGEAVASTVDSATGIPIYSLYGAVRTPTPEMLADLDLILVDLQDVGARYYTWLATTVEVLRAAARDGKRVVVLDRPNPLGGTVQGNLLDPAWSSAVGRLAVPMRHGLTLGELSLLARRDLGLETDLVIVPVSGWRRDLTFDRTGLPLVPPSPNLRDLEALFHYPGLCLFEATALSVGRGTDAPFRQLGAPWLDTAAILSALRAAPPPGVRFEAVEFTPRSPGDGKFADTLLAGIRLVVTDPDRYDPTHSAVVLLDRIRRRHPDRIAVDPARFDRLAGGPTLREALEAKRWPHLIVQSWAEDRAAYLARRSAVELYPDSLGAASRTIAGSRSN